MTTDLFVTHRAFTEFLRNIQGVLERATEPAQRLRVLVQPLQHLLMEDFLDASFREVTDPRGYSQYLLYRSSDRNVSIVATAIAPKVKLPIHDHKTWGVNGLYQGSQTSRVYRQDESAGGRSRLSQTRKQKMKSGDIGLILPPDEDLRAIEVTSKVPAVTVSVLGADIGCQQRHTYDRRSGPTGPFTTGYANTLCA